MDAVEVVGFRDAAVRLVADGLSHRHRAEDGRLLHVVEDARWWHRADVGCLDVVLRHRLYRDADEHHLEEALHHRRPNQLPSLRLRADGDSPVRLGEDGAHLSQHNQLRPQLRLHLECRNPHQYHRNQLSSRFQCRRQLQCQCQCRTRNQCHIRLRCRNLHMCNHRHMSRRRPH